jgi:heme/copper-type cytochrome/quinol oxidase subunit 4
LFFGILSQPDPIPIIFIIAFVGETIVQLLGFFLMAGQAERAQIIKAAFSAAFNYRRDVVCVPPVGT